MKSPVGPVVRGSPARRRRCRSPPPKGVGAHRCSMPGAAGTGASASSLSHRSRALMTRVFWTSTSTPTEGRRATAPRRPAPNERSSRRRRPVLRDLDSHDAEREKLVDEGAEHAGLFVHLAHVRANLLASALADAVCWNMRSSSLSAVNANAVPAVPGSVASDMPRRG